MPKKILLVDDEPTIVKVLTSRLKANGYDVITAADGQEALNIFRTETPDLVILDVMLPKVDGYRVCRLLKFDEKFKHVPILMLTARVQESDEQTGKAVGADAYLPKPFDAQTLLAKIKELIRD